MVTGFVFDKLQTWRDSGHYRCFTIKYFESDGKEWHIYGACAPFEQLYNVTMTHVPPEFDGSLEGQLGLMARGKGISEALINAVETIQRLRTLQAMNNVH